MTTPANTPTGHDADGPPQPAVWPAALIPCELSVHLMRNSTGFESPFTRFGQFDSLPGTVFLVTATFQGLDRAETRAFRAFIASMRGSAGLFYFPLVATDEEVEPQPEFDEDGQPAAEIVDDGPRIARLSEDFNGLETEGWDAEEGVLLLSAGDYISYDDDNGWRQAFVVVEDCICGPDGTADLVLEPNMPEDVPAGAMLHVDVPSAIFTLDSDDEGAIAESPDGFATVTINALQAQRPDFSSL